MLSQTCILLATMALLLFPGPPAAAQGTTPVPITFGTQDDIHPSTINSDGSAYDNIEWLAFVRMSGSGSRICLKKSNAGASSWEDSVYSITDDSQVNDYPMGARTHNRFMLVWQRGGSGSDICYSYNFGSGWSAPLAMTTDGAANRSPHVAISDTTFVAVWERGGQILFSKFLGGSWTTPLTISPVGDTLNSAPQVEAMRAFGDSLLFVFWEKLKPLSTSHAIFYSTCRNSVWSAADTIAWTGDNRRPKAPKKGRHGLVVATYESDRTGDWEIYSAVGDALQDTLGWENRAYNVSGNPLVDDVEGSFLCEDIPINIGGTRINWPQFLIAGSWRVISETGDSIFSSVCTGFSSYLSVGPGSIDQNPDFSPGVYSGNGWTCVWTIWENNSNGHWNLYGSSMNFTLSVDESGTMPSAIRLDQNYPNPFNPSTTIHYKLPHSSFVTLSIYNILGQQVATLVRERQQAGDHRVKFRGNGLPSGVYFYRLTSGDVIQTKRLLLLK